MFQEKCSNKLRLKFSITLIGNDFFFWGDEKCDRVKSPKSKSQVVLNNFRSGIVKFRPL